MVWRFLEKSTLFFKHVMKPKMFLIRLTLWVFRTHFDCLPLCEIWNEHFLYCQSMWPHPQTNIYFFTHKWFSQVPSMLLITLIALQLHVVFNTPEKLWLISRLFDVVVAEVPPPVLLSTWRYLAFSRMLKAYLCLHLPSIAPHITLRPGTLTTSSFWSLLSML